MPRRLACRLAAAVSLASCATGSVAMYYISSSNVNRSDSNAGSSPLAPWATLQRASIASPYLPSGAALRLRCGDVWPLLQPVNLSLPAHGGVTVTAYCDGDANGVDRPHVARVPGSGSGAALVFIDAVNFTLEGVHVSGGEVNVRLEYSAPGEYAGVTIHDCELEQARGVAPNASTGDGWGKSVQVVAMVQGVTVRNVSMMNNLVHDTDTWYLNDILPPPNPLSRTAVLGINVVGNSVRNASYNVLFLDSTQVVNVTANVFMRDTPRALFDKGTTDIIMGDLNTTFGVAQIVGNEMAWRGEAPGGPDGCAIDFETACGGVLVSGNYITHSYGAGIMVFDHDTRSQGLMLTNNVLLYDGCNQTSEDQGEISFMKVNSSGSVVNNTFATCPGVPVFHDTVPNASRLWTFAGNIIDGPGTPVRVTPDPIVNVTVSPAGGFHVWAALDPASPPGTMLVYTLDGSKPYADSSAWPEVGYMDLPPRAVAVNVKAFAPPSSAAGHWVESATAGGILTVAAAERQQSWQRRFKSVIDVE